MFTRTRIYSVYVRKDSKNPLDTAIFIKQGFNFLAFLFTMVWAFFNRLWFTGIVLTIFTIFFELGDSIEFSTASLIMAIWFGFEANNFKSRRLERIGYIIFDVVTGIDKLAAQTRFYDKYLLSKPSVKPSTFNFAS
jgi:hypothetical protein